jgi:prepilin-type N-terminal cleavage/methylation domain-containing protein
MTAYLKKYNLVKAMRGFTLIELLIVMAILGVLAVVVLVAINPGEQMRRARDSGRVSGVQQLGRALTAYYTSLGSYPTAATWNTDIVTSQDISVFPSNPGSADDQCTGHVNGFCYATGSDASGNEYATVYSLLVSEQNSARCGGATAYAVFSSYAGRGGIATDFPATSEPTWCQ